MLLNNSELLAGELLASESRCATPKNFKKMKSLNHPLTPTHPPL